MKPRGNLTNVLSTMLAFGLPGWVLSASFAPAPVGRGWPAPRRANQRKRRIRARRSGRVGGGR